MYAVAIAGEIRQTPPSLPTIRSSLLRMQLHTAVLLTNKLLFAFSYHVAACIC